MSNLAGDYCDNKYDHAPTTDTVFSGETRTITNPSPTAIEGVKMEKAAPHTTKFSRGQATKHSGGTPLYP